MPRSLRLPDYWRVLLFRLLVFVLPMPASGQEASEAVGEATYSPRVHSIRFHPALRPADPPVVDRQSADTLLLSFDVFDTLACNLNASLTYCNASWEPSGADIRELIGGYRALTAAPRFVRTGVIPCLHYTFELPGDAWHFLHSGNFLVTVTDSTGRPLFTSRLMVTGGGATVQGSVSPAPGAEENKFRQAIRFSVQTNDTLAEHAFSNLHVSVYQNGRTDNAMHGLRAQFAKDAVFDFTDPANQRFDGGNEYRQFRFSNRPGEFNGENRIRVHNDQVVLPTDEPRSSLKYVAGRDDNGRFTPLDPVITNPAAGYATVHFTLRSRYRDDGEVYVMGDFCRWEYSEDNRMRYDTVSQAYRLSYPLLEGRYDYLYVFRGFDRVNGETGVVEGDHSETENEYRICVYYRVPGSPFDELLTVFRLNSGK